MSKSMNARKYTPEYKAQESTLKKNNNSKRLSKEETAFLFMSHCRRSSRTYCSFTLLLERGEIENKCFSGSPGNP